MSTVQLWTGRETCALRRALRMSVRVFAEHLGVSPRTVSKWERLGEATRPYPDTQAILDTALQRGSADQPARFQVLLAGTPSALSLARKAPSVWDFETWADDLDRAVIALSPQDFTTSTMLTGRWLARFPAGQLDARGLYLHARSLTLLGDGHRDPRWLQGPQPAMSSYRRALSVYGELDIPRRVAQIKLSLTVVSEMGGELQAAARGYARLAGQTNGSATGTVPAAGCGSGPR